MKRAKKSRKVFNLYNLAVLLCLAIIIGSVLFLFEQDSEMIPTEWKEQYIGLKEKMRRYER